MNRRSFLLLLAALPAVAGPFIVEPYLQLGNHPRLTEKEALTLVWHTADEPADFAVAVKVEGEWSAPVTAASHRIAVRTIDPHLIWTADLSGLKPGKEFEYRVTRNKQQVFQAKSVARKSATQPYRFVVFGDSGASSPGQRAVATHAAEAKPDFLFITGDIVYSRGRISEYRPNHFGVYRDFLSTTPFIAVPGNHDIAATNLTAQPDGLAYFYYWDQPLNGPTETQSRGKTPVLQGDPADQQAFLQGAGPRFPKMANFSFDYGNSHWTVLDSNPNIDWNDPALREWVKQDIASGSKATWHIVAFHHPGIHSSKTHASEMQMRTLSPIFEEGGIDLVLAGHVHNYQRSRPLWLKPPTDFKIDGKYDGKKKTKPNGIIYIVTGGGGASLYDPPQQDERASWQPFTEKFVSQSHSFSVVDVDGEKLTFRQLDDKGKELDKFTMTK